MNTFTYIRTDDIATAVREAAEDADARFIAGGTNLIDLMKENVARPGRLIDITHTPLKEIYARNGGLRLGALATNTDVAYNQEVERRYPLLSRAILAGASPQLRNMATVGGNLLQRTRCCYFYDTATPCSKRTPEAGCSAISGFNRAHAILGTSSHCIATHPSDMCVALAALEATVNVTGTGGERVIPFAEFHRLPGDMPLMDTNLMPDEIITSVDLRRKALRNTARISRSGTVSRMLLRWFQSLLRLTLPVIRSGNHVSPLAAWPTSRGETRRRRRC